MVIKTRIEEMKGRKVIASGHIEDLTGKILVEASATFVQPRYAKLLRSTQLHKAMGERPPELSSKLEGSAEQVSLSNAQDLKAGH